MNHELTYKRIEITSKPQESQIVEGRVAFSFGFNNCHSFSYLSNSEAECLAQLNRHVKEFGEKLGQLS